MHLRDELFENNWPEGTSLEAAVKVVFALEQLRLELSVLRKLRVSMAYHVRELQNLSCRCNGQDCQKASPDFGTQSDLCWHDQTLLNL